MTLLFVIAAGLLSAAALNVVSAALMGLLLAAATFLVDYGRGLETAGIAAVVMSSTFQTGYVVGLAARARARLSRGATPTENVER